MSILATQPLLLHSNCHVLELGYGAEPESFADRHRVPHMDLFRYRFV